MPVMWVIDQLIYQFSIIDDQWLIIVNTLIVQEPMLITKSVQLNSSMA